MIPAIRRTTCDRALAGLVMLALMRAGEALASDQGASADLGNAEQKDFHLLTPVSAAPFVGSPFVGPLFSPRLSAVPGTYSMPELTEVKTFPIKDFRPRGRSILDTDSRLNAADDNLVFDKTIWERLNEYRNRDRIRVLTLWESGESAVSIQTNHKGDPSLQWTSRLMNRGGATHGLLDRLFPVSLFSEATRGWAHSASPSSSKPATGLGTLRASALGDRSVAP